MRETRILMGMPVTVTEVEDASPLGAAMLGGIGVGLYRDEKDAFQHVRKEPRTVEPDPAAAARYAQIFPIYKSLYPALRPVSHSVAGTQDA